MGEFVAVESFEALQQLRTALCRFADLVGAGLDEADGELQRAAYWVKQEQSGYWKREGDKRAEQLARAKSILARKKLQTTALGSRPSCVEEEKELTLAQRRVEEARQKVANVRRWSRRLDEETYSYQAVAGGLSQALTIEIPNALAQLDNMLIALEAYATSTAPGMQGSLADGTAPGGLGAEGPSGSMARVAPSPEVSGWQRLRALTPSPAQRESAPRTQPVDSHPAADKREPPWAALLASLGLERVPVADEDKIVVARGAAQQSRIYLERRAATGAGDSGWYVGVVDDTAPSEYDALRVADWRAMRPDLAAVLELPTGCLLVLDGAALVAALDRADGVLWPVPPMEPR